MVSIAESAVAMGVIDAAMAGARQARAGEVMTSSGNGLRITQPGCAPPA